MGRKLIDMNGFVKGKIKVVEYAGIDERGNALWKFECKCENYGISTGANIRNGNVKSCGCIRKDKGKKFMHDRNTTHGESRTRLYTIWGNIINRTTNESNKSYKEYGGRGITVCDEWKDFMKFKKWALENGYKEKLTIDRKDNDKGYSPDNCRWADWDTQNNNKQQSWKIEYRGKEQTVEQWAKEYNIRRETLVNRLKKGMNPMEALETPVKNGKGKGYKPKMQKNEELPAVARKKDI